MEKSRDIPVQLMFTINPEVDSFVVVDFKEAAQKVKVAEAWKSVQASPNQ